MTELKTALSILYKYFYSVPVFVCFPQRQSIHPPLNAVRKSRTVVGGGGVVSAYRVQEVVVCGHTNSSSSLGHGSTHAPLVGVWIETLH